MGDRIITVPSATVKAGLVAYSSPSGGNPEPWGTVVTLYVSDGQQMTTVPADLIGETASQAQRELANVNLEPEEVFEPVANPAQDGHVISTNPAPGTAIRQGSAVTLNVGAYTGPTTTKAAPTTTTATAAATTTAAHHHDGRGYDHRHAHDDAHHDGDDRAHHGGAGRDHDHRGPRPRPRRRAGGRDYHRVRPLQPRPAATTGAAATTTSPPGPFRGGHHHARALSGGHGVGRRSGRLQAARGEPVRH